MREMFPDQYKEALIETDTGYKVEDNVIILNRWTKTKGSA
jgi:hypothetical protein